MVRNGLDLREMDAKEKRRQGMNNLLCSITTNLHLFYLARTALLCIN